MSKSKYYLDSTKRVRKTKNKNNRHIYTNMKFKKDYKSMLNTSCMCKYIKQFELISAQSSQILYVRV